MQDALPKTLDVLHAGMAAGLHIGAQLCVYHEGQIIADYVLGESRPGVLMQHDTLVPWLSAGKPLTAVALAWLWERKLLKLDDAVSRYLPEFAANGKADITLRHCLTHTAGLRMAISAWTRQTFDEAVATVCAAPLEAGPDGTKWIPGQQAGYHVASTWFILGKIIEVISTHPLEKFLAEQIFKPLGMTDVFISCDAERCQALGDRWAIMHDTSSAEPKPMSWTNPDILATPRPASGALGPANQLARFYQQMSEPGLPGTPHTVLNPATRAALTARHRVGMIDATFKCKVDWGLGFICESSHYGQPAVPYQFGTTTDGRGASPRAFGHGGNQSSVGMYDPEHKLAIGLVFNGMPGDARHDKRLRETLKAVYEDVLA